MSMDVFLIVRTGVPLFIYDWVADLEEKGEKGRDIDQICDESGVIHLGDPGVIKFAKSHGASEEVLKWLREHEGEELEIGW